MTESEYSETVITCEIYADVMISHFYSERALLDLFIHNVQSDTDALLIAYCRKINNPGRCVPFRNDTLYCRFVENNFISEL